MLRFGLGAIVSLAGIVACGGSSEPAGSSGSSGSSGTVATGATKDYVTVDAEKLCKLVTQDCPEKISETYEQCLGAYKAARVTTQCKAAIDSLTCTSSEASIETCFPTCTPGSDPGFCDGPNATACSTGGQRYTFECNGVCATQNLTWSGVCGTKYGSITSPTVKCWCM